MKPEGRTRLYNGITAMGLVHVSKSHCLLIDFSLKVKATTFIFISGGGSAISSAKEGKPGFIYNLIESK